MERSGQWQLRITPARLIEIGCLNSRISTAYSADAEDCAAFCRRTGGNR